jgi:aryl-alcohol dehydrogenase-like predicted oxidoreductase
MGMGIMPWSPLKHGFLSGKFRRDNAGSVEPSAPQWASRARRNMSWSQL